MRFKIDGHCFRASFVTELTFGNIVAANCAYYICNRIYANPAAMPLPTVKRELFLKLVHKRL